MNKFFQFYVIVDKYGDVHDTYVNKKEANHYYSLRSANTKCMAVKASVSKYEDSQELAVYVNTMK